MDLNTKYILLRRKTNTIINVLEMEGCKHFQRIPVPSTTKGLKKKFQKLKNTNEKVLKRLYELNPKIYKEIIETTNFGGSGCVIIDESGENVVLVKDALFNALKWGFPKGGKEYTKKNCAIRLETDEECYKREVYEETSIDLNQINYDLLGSKTVRNRTFYKIRLKEHVEIDNYFDDEIKGVKWQKITDINIYDRNQYNSGVYWCVKDNFL